MTVTWCVNTVTTSISKLHYTVKQQTNNSSPPEPDIFITNMNTLYYNRTEPNCHSYTKYSYHKYMITDVLYHAVYHIGKTFTLQLNKNKISVYTIGGAPPILTLNISV